MRHTDAELEDDYLEDEDTQKDKYLSFQIAGEDYAVEIKYVVEIVGIQKITAVPDMPAYIKGVINLRGQIIPVIDVRARFLLEEKAYGDRTCIVIVDLSDTIVGLIVDEVAEVLMIPADLVAPAPKTGKGSQSRYIQGIGRAHDRVELILAVEALLHDVEDIAELVADVEAVS